MAVLQPEGFSRKVLTHFPVFHDKMVMADVMQMRMDLVEQMAKGGTLKEDDRSSSITTAKWVGMIQAFDFILNMGKGGENG